MRPPTSSPAYLTKELLPSPQGCQAVRSVIVSQAGTKIVIPAATTFSVALASEAENVDLLDFRRK